MIFITVGTHEQGMERLLIELDRLIENKVIQCEVIAQIGYSDYKPQNYKYKELITYNEMDKMVSKADIVITHGGPGSIFHAIQYNKIPIVVPRNPEFNEHIDDHQILFCKRLESNNKILSVYNIEKLEDVIVNYDHLSKKCVVGKESSNEFISKFTLLVDNLWHEKT